MIQANELKLGNYLKLKTGESVIVGEIRESEHVENHYIINGFDMRYLFPVPLDEEILFKFGFEKHTVKMSLVNWEDYRKSNMVINVTNGGFEVEYGSELFSIEERTHIRTIQYLHQLQNLYYALTGTELTVNLC